jgi:GDP-L-fucose synthase
MKVFVAGHRGLVGSAIVRQIEADGRHTWIGKTRAELDLLNREQVFDQLEKASPEALVIAAAKVGGIMANSTQPVEFLSENIQIQTNLLDAAHTLGIRKVVFLGSSCIYPKECPQPIREEYLLTGPLEVTNEAYAIAKISGVKLVDGYNNEYGHHWVSLMPTNLYGPNDNFDRHNSHVLPALIRKINEAVDEGTREITLWGDGSPLREFLHSDDLASAVLLMLSSPSARGLINVGSGIEISIQELAQQIAGLTGYQGRILWDTQKPNGTMRKILDSGKIRNLGWEPKIDLATGLRETNNAFLANREKRAGK